MRRRHGQELSDELEAVLGTYADALRRAGTRLPHSRDPQAGAPPADGPA
ncbi:hypothetical protein [Micromonospora sp. SL4-19]